MRISQAEKAAILAAVRDQDPDAVVYLFGSRARDDLKGGDIDLLVISKTITFSTKLEILAQIKIQIGDQKIDLKIASPEHAASDPFIQSVFAQAVRLDDQT